MKKLFFLIFASMFFVIPNIDAAQGARRGIENGGPTPDQRLNRLFEIAGAMEELAEQPGVLIPEDYYQNLFKEGGNHLEVLRQTYGTDNEMLQGVANRILAAGEKIIDKKEKEKWKISFLLDKITQTKDTFEIVDNPSDLKEEMQSFLDLLIEEKFIEEIYDGVFADLDKKFFDKIRRGPLANLKEAYKAKKRDLIREKISSTYKNFEGAANLVDLNEIAKAFVLWLKEHVVKRTYPRIFDNLDVLYFGKTEATPFVDLRRLYKEKRKGFERDILEKGSSSPW